MPGKHKAAAQLWAAAFSFNDSRAACSTALPHPELISSNHLPVEGGQPVWDLETELGWAKKYFENTNKTRKVDLVGLGKLSGAMGEVWGVLQACKDP